MRSCIALVIILTHSVALGQDWALINPAYRYNYSDDGTDTISNQIRVLGIDALGLDGIRYTLNTISRRCAPCMEVPSMCDAQAGLITNVPQYLGYSTLVNGTQWTLFGVDTLVLQVGTSLGDSWVAGEGIMATVSAVTPSETFGAADSVKRIDLTNGMSFLLSKAFGVVEFINGDDAFTLVGLQGAIDVGERFPRVIDLFNYQPGDILQYRATENGTDGVCVHYANERNKYVILSRTDDVDHTVYTVRSVRSYQFYSTPIIGMFGCDGGGTTTSEDTLQLVIQHDGWTPENFLGSCWLDQLWPQAFAEPGIETEFAGPFASTYAGSQWRGYMDGAGRYVCEPAALGSPQTSPMTTVMACDAEAPYWPVNWDEIIGRYIEGVGFTYGNYLGFEHSSEKILEGYVIGGSEYGTVTPDDIILDLPLSKGTESRSLNGPNPTSDELALANCIPGTSFLIIDAQGRPVLTGVRSTSQLIDVRTLSPGSYLFLQAGSAPERFMIVR